jgi:hypothetical protein
MRRVCIIAVLAGLLAMTAGSILVSLASEPVAPSPLPARNQPYQRVGDVKLTPRVTVKRVDRFLKLDCQLLDANGQKYQGNLIDRYTHPPQFAVYQGDRQVGSGTFAYG